MRTILLKLLLIFAGLVVLLLLNEAFTGTSGRPSMLWPILSIAYVGFIIAIIKWKPKKDKEKGDNDKLELKKD